MIHATGLIFLAVIVVAAGLQTAYGADAKPVTATYTEGRRGYRGARCIWLTNAASDRSSRRGPWLSGGGGPEDMLVGRPQGKREREFRGLLKFSNLNLHAGSKILSARITLPSGEILGRPRVAIYGMLKNWHAPPKEPRDTEPSALDGETTWNSQYHSQQKWGAPGVDKTSDNFEYDGDADRHTEADSIIEVKDMGRITFDVTHSLASQVAGGKEYGWLLAELSEGDDAVYINPNTVRAGLTVRYIPPPGVEVKRTAPPQLRLINFHLAEPWDMLKNPDRLRKLPFDGAVWFGQDNRHNMERPIVNSVFGPDKLTYEDYSDFVESAREICRPPSVLPDNFLRVNLSVPGTLERRGEPFNWENSPTSDEPVQMWWADGFDAVVHNMEVAARIAKAGGMKGMFFDGEPYKGDIWSFVRQADAEELGKTYEETCVQVRHRAGQLAEAINEHYPDMTLIMYFYAYQSAEKNADMLWNAFMDGFIEKMDPRMRLVVANSPAYVYVAKEKFEALYEWDYFEAPKVSAVPDKYLRQVEVGFGLWFDYKGWSGDPELRASSAQWQVRLENALAVADSYVWVYTGRPRWWIPGQVPQTYINATYRALDLAKRRAAQ